MRPLLSVVIPAFNVAPYIAAAVRSALNQTLAELEVIVVDDGSTDDTPKILAGMASPRLRVIRRDNGGLSAARNAGILAASAPYVGLLDGDDVWMPDKATKQLAVLERCADVTMTYSHSAYLDAGGRPTGDLLLSRPRRPDLRRLVRRNLVGNGSTAIGRTADFIAAGLFDTRLRNSHEDYEMWPRLMARTGRALELVPEPLTGYRVRGDSSSMCFANFLATAECACHILAASVPGLPAWVRREGLAQNYRIAARKAASLGRRGEALSYLGRALAIAPWLPAADPRFLPTLALALSGGVGRRSLYRAQAMLLGRN